MKITIVQAFSKNKFPMNSVALLIKKFQKTNYSHYAIRVEDPNTNEVFYYDSTGGGTRKRGRQSFFRSHEITKSFSVSKEISYIDYTDFWFMHEGKSYGFIQIVGLALKLLNIVKNNPFGQGAKRLICNELVILFLNEFGYTCIIDTDSLDLNDTEEILNKVL